MSSPVVFALSLAFLHPGWHECAAQSVATLFTPSGVSGGGRLLSATLNPEQPEQALIVCDMMGLYRTDDEGLSWSLVHTDVFAASLRTRMTYAGSGVNQRLYGIRKLKWGSSQTLPAVSEDGGRSWVDLAEPEETSEQKQYYSLVADPAGASESTQRLVMDNYRKLWFSQSGDPEETPSVEIHGVTGST